MTVGGWRARGGIGAGGPAGRLPHGRVAAAAGGVTLLDVEMRRVEGRVVLVLGGDLDLASAPDLRQRMVEAVAESAPGHHLVVDLDGLDFVDDVGLGVLIGGAMRARSRGGSFTLVCSGERLLKVLALSGLDRAMEVHPTLAAALRSRA